MQIFVKIVKTIVKNNCDLEQYADLCQDSQNNCDLNQHADLCQDSQNNGDLEQHADLR